MTLRPSAFCVFAKPNMRVCVCVLNTLCLLPGAGRRTSAAAQRESWFQSCDLGELPLAHTHTFPVVSSPDQPGIREAGGGQAACLSAPVPYCLDCLDCLDGCPTLPLAGSHSAVSDPSWFPSGFNPKPQPSSKPGFGRVNKGTNLATLLSFPLLRH